MRFDVSGEVRTHSRTFSGRPERSSVATGKPMTGQGEKRPMRVTTSGVNARAKAIQPWGWPAPVLSTIGRTANIPGPRARCTMPLTRSAAPLSWPEVTACLMRASSSGSGGISYSWTEVASSASDARVSRLRSSTRNVSTSRRTRAAAFSDCEMYSGRLPRTNSAVSFQMA